MTAILIAAGTLAGLTLIAGLALNWAHARLPANDDGLIDAIDALLPQTQCGQCGHPGCRPYAKALATGAPMDLCPPGGEATFAALKALLGRDDGAAPAEPQPVTARIREPECIGCALCLAPCPVDAIVGAPGFMHTVMADQCTGCELCLPACPVDCIELVAMEAFSLPQNGTPLTAKEQPASRGAVSICSMEAFSLPQNGTPLTAKEQPASRRAVSICSMEAFSLPQNGTPLTAKEQPASRRAVSICSMEAFSLPQNGRPLAPKGQPASRRAVFTGSTVAPAATGNPPADADAPCIGCNRCEPECPQTLAPQHLLRLIRGDQLDAAAATGLDRCIECRLCDRACPSGIPLAHLFRAAKDERRARDDRQARAAAAKAQFDARKARLAADEVDAQSRREQRLAGGSGRQW